MLLRKIAVALLCLAPTLAFATGPTATVQWEVRTTGNDSNGGGFDAYVASPGTDESQQNSGTSVTITLTGTGTTGTSSPAFTATTHGPGNLIHVTSGTGCTTGWYELISQSSGTGTFDRAMGSNTNVCTATLGGGLLTPQGLFTAWNSNTTSNAYGNIAWFQAGTYTITSNWTPPGTSFNFIGYNSSHGDFGTRPLITTATNSTHLVQMGSGTLRFDNINFSNTAATPSVGFYCNGSPDLFILNAKLSGFANTVSCEVNANPATSIHMSNVEISGGTGSVILANWQAPMVFEDMYIHGGTGTVFDLSGNNGTSRSFTMSNVIIDAAAGGHCIYNPNGNGTLFTNVAIKNVTCYNASGDGIDWSIGAPTTSSGVMNYDFENIVVYTSTAYCLRGPVVTTASSYSGLLLGNFRNNATGNCTTAASINWFNSTNAVTLSANPFTSAGTGDFSLNATAGGGAALKAAGNPGAFPGATSTGYLSIGAVEPNPSGGGTGASNYGFTQ